MNWDLFARVACLGTSVALIVILVFKGRPDLAAIGALATVAGVAAGLVFRPRR